ncbi:MAG: condensation domain-containing protein, partial [Bacteroidota bacterium]
MKTRKNLHLAQQDIYYEQIMNPRSALYNIGGYITFKGKIDSTQFKKIIQNSPDEIDIFKIKFDFTGSGPLYYQKDKSGPIHIGELDFSKSTNPQKEAMDWMQNEFSIPFDIYQGELYRFTFIKVAEDRHILFGCFHHLIIDGFGFAVYSNYLIDRYKKNLVDASVPEITYPSYFDAAKRSIDYLESEQYKKDARYWKDKYHSIPDLVLSRKKQKKEKGSLFLTPIPEPDRASLNRLSDVTKTNISQLTVAALLIYFGKTKEQRVFSFGLPLHKRRGRDERKTVGMFSGVLPFKGEFNAEKLLSDLFSDIKKTQRDDFRHGLYPISHLNRSLKLLSKNRQQLFDIIVNYEPFTFPHQVSPDLSVRIKDLRSTTDLEVPLTVRWMDYGQNSPLELQIIYKESYFNAGEIKLLSKSLLFMLRQFENSLDIPIKDISIIPKEERLQLLEGFNDTKVDFPKDTTIVDLFRQRADSAPGAIAVVSGGESITYRQLHRRTDQLARHLVQKGVAPQEPVGVAMERGIGMIVSIIAILKAGAAYVPIDHMLPVDRVRYIIKDASIRVIIGNRESLARLQGADIQTKMPWEEIQQLIN